MSHFATANRWLIPSNVLADSITAMAPDGARGCEGIVMWLGREQDGVAEITRLVSLRGPDVERRPGLINIPSHVLYQVDLIAEKEGAYLVGQIHSHPGNFVDLSWVDREDGISTPHYLSVVAPHYAQDPRTTWPDCGVHVCDTAGVFHRLTPVQAQVALSISPTLRAPITTLEG